MSTLPPASDGDSGEDKGDESGEAVEHAHPVDVEAAWADIIAHWDSEPGVVGSWPAQEDVDPDAPAAPLPGTPPPAVPPHGRAGPPSEHDHAAGRHRRPADPAPAPGPEDGVGERPRRRRTDPPGVDLTGQDAPVPGLDDRFVPPEPPPLPRAGWRTWLPWLGVLGAPVFFLVIVLVQPALPGSVLLGVVLAFVAGFVTLVLRMPAHRDDDDDDGAVV